MLTASVDRTWDGDAAAPTFAEAHETDKVTDAVLKSGETGQWEAP